MADYELYKPKSGTVFKVFVCGKDGKPLEDNQPPNLPELKSYLRTLYAERVKLSDCTS